MLVALANFGLLMGFILKQANKLWQPMMIDIHTSVKFQGFGKLNSHVTDSISQVRVVNLQRHLTARSAINAKKVAQNHNDH